LTVISKERTASIHLGQSRLLLLQDAYAKVEIRMQRFRLFAGGREQLPKNSY